MSAHCHCEARPPEGALCPICGGVASRPGIATPMPRLPRPPARVPNPPELRVIVDVHYVLEDGSCTFWHRERPHSYVVGTALDLLLNRDDEGGLDETRPVGQPCHQRHGGAGGEPPGAT